MPLQVTEIDFQDEIARLETRMEDVAEKQVEWSHNEDRAQELLIRGNELNNQANVLRDFAEGNVDGWPAFETVTLAGLTAGEVNRVEDTVESNPGVRERDAWVGIGTRDGPYVEHDPDAVRQDGYEQTVANVTDLPLAYVRWAEGRITELSHLDEGKGNGYLKLVREKQREASNGENG